MALKVVRNKLLHNFMVCEGKNPLTRAILFTGSKSQCNALVLALTLDDELSLNIVTEWVEKNKFLIDQLGSRDLEEYLSLEGWAEMRKVLHNLEIERLVRKRGLI